MNSTITQIEALARAFAATTLRQFKEGSAQEIAYDANGRLIGDFEAAFTHCGLYGIRAVKDGHMGIIYIGKAQNAGRLRHHLERRNKNGTVLAESMKNKHREIRAAIEDGYTLFLCLYLDAGFGRASLSCLEIALSLAAREDFKRTFPGIEHWNRRIG
jgi:hypothetical protein